MSFTRIISGAVVAALAFTAQAQTFSNSTSTSSSAAPSGTLAPSSLTVGGKTWNYEGCASDPSSNFGNFTQVETSPLMTIERCLSDCSAFQFAGVNGPRCFCSNSQSNSTAIVPSSSCNYACRGNPAEQCGGSSVGAAQPISKRQLGAGVLLTLYEAAGANIDVSVYTSVVVSAYVDIGINGLTTVPYTETQTLTHCGCTDKTPSATIPMTTTVTTCGCGKNGALETHTLTIPCALASSAPATTTTVVPCSTAVLSLAPNSSTTVTLAPTGSPCPGCATAVIGGSTVTLAPSGAAQGTVASAAIVSAALYTGAASHNGAAAGVVGALALAAAML